MSIFLAFNTPGYPWVSTKKFSPIGPAVWPAIRNIYMNILFYYIDYLLAEGSGVARGEKNWKIKIWKKNWKKCRNLLAYNAPRLPMSVHKKYKPNRSSRLAGYIYVTYIYIYECLVLIYRWEKHSIKYYKFNKLLITLQ